MTYTNQIQIVHISDLHFGNHHICNPGAPQAAMDGIPDLAKLIGDDLRSDFGATFSTPENYAIPEELPQSIPKEPPLIVALTGDFTQQAEHNEFRQAQSFLNTLLSKPLLNREINKNDIFMIPGNHDVVFDRETPNERFQPYCSFYNEFFEGTERSAILPHKALSITQVHTLERDRNKILIAEINCCMYVQRNTLDQSRGQVSQEAIEKIRAELEKVSKAENLNDYIKIAMIHHHVVLLPSFLENFRGLDSVVNARDLLELLSEYDFHIILHGHKHYPQIFTYDPLPLWTKNENKIPQLVIAGGSCGSTELATDASSACNTYGIITIKWHPSAKQARIRVITRGLIRTGPAGPLPPYRWKWSTINVTDKIITPYQTLPDIGASEIIKWDMDGRQQRYMDLRGQMPVVEVMPSLIPGQAYEARVWITSHGIPLPSGKQLIKVEWSAGEMYPKQICYLAKNPNFCIAYQYWGPMQIEVKLTFEDGYETFGYVYARMPKNESNK